jgi:hypothetical protein
MPTMNSCRCGDREGRPRVPPGWWQERGGRRRGRSNSTSPLPAARLFPSLGDIFHMQAGVTVDPRLPKRTRTEIGPLTGSSPQTHLALVSHASRGSTVVPQPGLCGWQSLDTTGTPSVTRRPNFAQPQEAAGEHRMTLPSRMPRRAPRVA